MRTLTHQLRALYCYSCVYAGLLSGQITPDHCFTHVCRVIHNVWSIRNTSGRWNSEEHKTRERPEVRPYLSFVRFVLSSKDYYVVGNNTLRVASLLLLFVRPNIFGAVSGNMVY